MLKEERRQRILELVTARGFVSLGDLMRAVRGSQSTLRRDLAYWQGRGVLRRTHGGAVANGEANGMPALADRLERERDEKRAIAAVAAARIADGDTVLLDGGTTTLEVARLLVGRAVQIVTNSLAVAELFLHDRGDTRLVVLGGDVYPRTGVLLGPLTARSLEGLHVGQFIMSTGGITADGLFNSNNLLVETERQMMRCADEVVVVADHTKIGRRALAFLCPLTEIDTFIVDRALSDAQRLLLQEADVRVLVAGEPEEFAP